jgi:hypothetical protein
MFTCFLVYKQVPKALGRRGGGVEKRLTLPKIAVFLNVREKIVSYHKKLMMKNISYNFQVLIMYSVPFMLKNDTGEVGFNIFVIEKIPNYVYFDVQLAQ